MAVDKKDTSVTTIDDAPLVVEVKKAADIAVSDHADAMTGERLEVTIQASEGDIGKQPVFLAINGYGVLVPRGIPVHLPVELVEILDNATQVVYEHDKATDKMLEREVKRYSYSVRAIRATTKK